MATGLPRSRACGSSRADAASTVSSIRPPPGPGRSFHTRAQRAARSASWPLPAAGSPRLTTHAAATSAGTPTLVSTPRGAFAFRRSVLPCGIPLRAKVAHGRRRSPPAVRPRRCRDLEGCSTSVRAPTALPERAQVMPRSRPTSTRSPGVRLTRSGLPDRSPPASSLRRAAASTFCGPGSRAQSSSPSSRLMACSQAREQGIVIGLVDDGQVTQVRRVRRRARESVRCLPTRPVPATPLATVGARGAPRRWQPPGRRRSWR